MMTNETLASLLKAHGIQPSVQRLAIAQFVLQTDRHPTADQVYQAVRATLPVMSRATVYNTLNLFVAKGLLRSHVLDDGPTLYDANVDQHHHLIDDETGQVIDLPWDAIEVKNLDGLPDYEVVSYTVIVRGRRRGNSGPEA
jgi:Fe2+ or Zn2+ uptake regulation protein